jgi:lysine-specific demethylase 8
LGESFSKRRRLEDVNGQQQRVENEWLGDVVRTLDMGISLSGAPGRSKTFEAVFRQLENHIESDDDVVFPSQWSIQAPTALSTDHPIARAGSAISFEAFQHHLNTKVTPIITPGAINHWPASKNWHDPTYFLHQTLSGRRIVPIEIGKSYTDPDWRQSVMPFRDFLTKYILPPSPAEIGYLAQHDLFAQIPALRGDITVPDYCYTTPPPPKDAAAKTAGLASTPQLTEPTLNIWFGPSGTRTPLHTDPYHNILCQVVGYKYIRLYPPCETANLYPRGTDDKGINMENTSQVDVSKHVRTSSLLGGGNGATDSDTLKEATMKFPKFEEAQGYVEGVLGPGESVYVPLGWWHYVEGLTVGISVSFWWN